MKLVLDMNLSPEWCDVLTKAGWPTIHWSAVGSRTALDAAIMEWAGPKGHVVVTADLDFGEVLALTGANGPSVVLLRLPDVRPAASADVVVSALQQCTAALDQGALLVVDGRRARVRVLPLRR